MFNRYALTALREARLFTPEQLAKRATLPVEHLAALEAGEREPEPFVLEALARALHADVRALDPEASA